MRVNRFVAAASGLSRRAADLAVADGRVTVDGEAVGVGFDVADGAAVRLDGALLSLPERHRLVMLNKPVGYVCSRVRQGEAPTVYELLPAEFSGLRPVGRLDRDSSGLLLFSDDGDFIFKLTHPSQDKNKVYRVKLARPLSASDIEWLESGVELEDGPSVLKVETSVGRTVTVSLREGRNRQLRRTFGEIDNGIIDLQRVSMGEFQLADLPVGRWRELEAPTAAEASR
jgi:23S rRNA pseudouridine2605 synthase